MNILMVVTNPDFVTKVGGTTVGRGKLVTLFSHNNDMVYLNALPQYVENINIPSGPLSNTTHITYYFKQLFIFGKCVPMFTDLNIAFLLRIKDVVKKEKIDLICITEPYGIISASFICRHTPVVYDAHDIASEHARIAFQRLKMYFRIIRLAVIRQIARTIFLNYISLLERLACKRAKHIIAVTEGDKQGFMREYHIDETKITAIPIWVAVDDFNKISSKRKQSVESHKFNIIFHGIYHHPANYEAFRLIEDYIAPEVKKYSNNIEFLLAGTDVPKFTRGNIKSLGYVADLSWLFEACSMAIVPVLQGTGVNMKVLDYMAAGLPIIATRRAVESIGLEDGKHAIILDKVDDNFIDAILSLASDRERREILGKNAVELIRKKHNRKDLQNKLDNMLIKIKAGVIN